MMEVNPLNKYSNCAWIQPAQEYYGNHNHNIMLVSCLLTSKMPGIKLVYKFTSVCQCD